MAAPTFTAPLAALTTIFRPPCPTSWVMTGTQVFSQLPPFPSPGPVGCDPPLWQQNLAGGGFQYYSPAICPSGFAVGPSCGVTKTRTQEGFPAVRPDENVAYCVPAGMTCTTDTTDFRGGVWGMARGGGVVTVGPAMQIRWRDADLSALETHPLTPGLFLRAAATFRGGTRVTLTAATAVPDDDPLPLNPMATDVLPMPRSTATTSMSPPTSSSSGGSPTATAPGSAQGISDDHGPGKHSVAVFVAVIVAVLVGIMLGVLSLIAVRRHKAGKLTGVSASVVGWMLREKRDDDGSGEKGKLDDHGSLSRVEIGYPQIPPALAELDNRTGFGSEVNPAELDGWGVAERPKRWMRRVRGVPRRPGRPKSLSVGQLPWMMVHRMPTLRESLREGTQENVEPLETPPKVAQPDLPNPRPLASRSSTWPRPRPSIELSVQPIPFSPSSIGDRGIEHRLSAYWESSERPAIRTARGP
ncbi:hypothetical protein QBC39DRAFT_84954 [Podospora conica]|nr:hypothetical protein QBC39DRAFT_84954 [Schizothecium conicum]